MSLIFGFDYILFSIARMHPIFRKVISNQKHEFLWIEWLDISDHFQETV